MRRQVYVFPCVVICLAATSLAIGAAVRNMHSRSVLGAQMTVGDVRWIPYQISYKQYGSEPDYGKKPEGEGRLLVFGEIVRAVRSDGSQAESDTSFKGDGSVDYRYRMVARSDGVRVRSYDNLGLMTAVKNPRLPNALARQAFDPSRSCATSFGGNQTNPNMMVSQDHLFGYETYKIFVDMKAARYTIWRAPALGCAELRTLFEKLDPESGRDRKSVV